jgi:phosphodiesterase/alkaline phosphatase D-like protein
VRAVDATSALIWVELLQATAVDLNVTPLDQLGQDNVAQPSRTLTSKTVKVGSRYYAALQVNGLEPSTWYHYNVHAASSFTLSSEAGRVLPLQCFRTFDRAEARQPLTLAYGSCRKLSDGRKDALGAFGRWLVHHYEQRETLWPRFLLLIGDQIYADEPSATAVRFNSYLRGGAKTFSEFASLYEFAWTCDQSVRQALAVLPTFMICDDHEITNNWNNRPFWRAALLRYGHNERLLVDGLVAYWVYQAWGNLLSGAQDRSAPHDTPLYIMQEAARSGEDALEPLREVMRRAVYGETRLRWHYTVPTSPPLFVTDARADREARFNKPIRRLDKNVTQKATRAADEETPARIMSHEQIEELKSWLQTHDTELVMLVSSVPVLLPPAIGLAEYIMGKRIDPARSRSWRWPLRLLGHLQQKVANRVSFDHWAVFGATWKEVVQLLASHRHDILVLSGDVHFSYSMEACVSNTLKSRSARLYQFVCSPFENHLGTRSRRRILAQSWCQRANYGGLSTRVRRLKDEVGCDATERTNRRIHNNLLLGNTLAIVTFQPRENGTHQVQQRYFGSHEGQFQTIASSTFHTKQTNPASGTDSEFRGTVT